MRKEKDHAGHKILVIILQLTRKDYHTPSPPRRYSPYLKGREEFDTSVTTTPDVNNLAFTWYK